MHFNLYHWLFDDPYTATGTGTPEKFHFLIPWLVFCCLGLLITFYYSVEGRKRFVRNNPVVKYMLDRYLGWFAVICFVAFPLIFSRVFLDAYFFAWRFWRYLWLLSLVIWAVFWVVYLVRKYPQDVASYKAYQNRRKYEPKSSRDKRRAKAGSR